MRLALMPKSFVPRAIVCAIACSTLADCSSTVPFDFSASEKRQLSDELLIQIGPAEVALEKSKVLYLSDEIKAQLSSRIDKDWAAQRKLRELRKMLFSEAELGISYAAGDTRTAMQTLEARSGNCLSMSNLFIASARHVGLDASFQTVEVKPSWDHSGGTMIRYEHIVATGRMLGESRYVVDFLPEFILGDYDSAPVADRIALALYYSNLGAESLVENDTGSAITHLKKSLSLNADSSDAWSNLGAAMRRAGKFELAEYSYSRALKSDPQNFSALNNLVALYQFQGRKSEAKLLSERVARYRGRNPYYHFFLANLLLEKGEYEDALSPLRRSIRLKHDESDFYRVLAQTHAALGDVHSSQRMAARARKYQKKVPTVEENEMGHRFWTDGVLIRH